MAPFRYVGFPNTVELLAQYPNKCSKFSHVIDGKKTLIYRNFHHCSKTFSRACQENPPRLIPLLFFSPAANNFLLCLTFILHTLERRTNIFRTLMLTASEIMAPENVFEQGDFTISYVRFNGIFNTLYGSATMTDVSIDSAAEHFRGRCIGSTWNIHGWSLDEKNTTLFVDNSAPWCNSMVKPPAESDLMCQNGANIMLQGLDALLTARYHNAGSWDTVATEAGKGVLHGLSVLLSYAGNMLDRIAPPGGWDLTMIADWIMTDPTTDDHPVSGETTEVRQAFRLVWPYCSTVLSENVNGQDSYDNCELFMDYSSNDNGEEDASGMEGFEAVKSNTMEDEDEDMDRLPETSENLTVMDGEPMDVS